MNVEQIIKEVRDVIKPETDLEKQIIWDEEFYTGALWGEPRKGHPEGKVIHHIREVLDNIDKLVIDGETRRKLRLIAIIHDTFKYKVDTSKSRDGENHHAMIARRFAERYISSGQILDIIELHDEAYNAWCKGDRDGKWHKAQERALRLLNRLGDNTMLYLRFYKCDNETGNKSQNNYTWFENMAYIL